MDLSVKAMDSKETSADAERYPLFCHALPCKARNDGSIFFKQDSRSYGVAVDFYSLQRILGFCDDFKGCRVQSKGAYLVYVTAALRDDSLKSAQKTNPPAKNNVKGE